MQPSAFASARASSSPVNVGKSRAAVVDFVVRWSEVGEPPIAVSASGTNHFPGTPENLAYVTLFYESGTIAHANVSWLAPVKVRQILIGGSQKMIAYDDLEPSEKVKIYDKGVSFTDNPQQIHEMKPDVFVKLTNQLKTTALSLPTFRYARAQKSEDAVTAQYGTPDLVHDLKMEGALPESASAYREREERKRKEFPDDQALMMIPALITLSSTLDACIRGQ